jgi:hypothetical protein
MHGKFDTPNEVWIYIAEARQEHGFFKDCVHLRVGGGSNGFQFNPYEPFCDEHSLVPYAKTYPYVCPKTCLLFKNKKTAERAEKWNKRREFIRSASRVPFRYFERLKATTQGLILLFLLIAFGLAINKLNTVLEIVKALRGGK